MSIRSAFVVLLALVCGLSAAVGMNQLRKPVKVEAKVETAPVVVAVANIDRGKLVGEKDVEVRPWPKNLVPQGALSEVKSVAERAVMLPILAGEPVLEAKLGAKGWRGLNQLIRPGFRAYTILAARASLSVGGFIRPGDKVDVLLNIRSHGQDDETGGGTTTTLLQVVEILAVDQTLGATAADSKNPKDLNSVTLLVTPEQANVLDLGQNQGQLSLALRNPEDTTEVNIEPVTMDQIRFRHDKPVEVAKEEPKPEPAKVIPAVAVEEEPVKFEIVTLRGNQRGRVWITAAK